jgi:DNA-directed RNA polymerase specialized sigma subunit
VTVEKEKELLLNLPTRKTDWRSDLGDITSLLNEEFNTRLSAQDKQTQDRLLKLETDMFDSIHFIKYVLFTLQEKVDNINRKLNNYLEIKTRLTDKKLTANQQKILDFVKSNPPMPQQQIAAAVGMSRSYVSHIIKRLRIKGLLTA